MTETPVPRLARLYDLFVAMRHELQTNDHLSMLGALDGQLAQRDVEELIALRNAAYALFDRINDDIVKRPDAGDEVL